MTTPDRFSFRPPRGAFPLRRHVAEALRVEKWVPKIIVHQDPQRADTVYLECTKAQRIEILAQSVALVGVEKDGNMRDYIQHKRNTVPTCPRCQAQHWAYQTCY